MRSSFSISCGIIYDDCLKDIKIDGIVAIAESVPIVTIQIKGYQDKSFALPRKLPLKIEQKNNNL